MSMRFDGTDRRAVVRVTAPGVNGSSTPDEVVLSPDGRRAVVRANRKVWLVTVPLVGGEPPTVSVTGSTMPAHTLTDIGGDFVGWSRDGSVAHWSIGRSYFQHDVALADSLIAAEAAAERAEAEEPSETDPADEGGDPDADPEGPDEAAEEESGEADEDHPAYEPFRIDVEITVEKDRPEGVLELKDAALYQALHRIEGEGWIESEWGLSENNRRAKFYRLTKSGERALRREAKSFREYAAAVFKVLGQSSPEAEEA